MSTMKLTVKTGKQDRENWFQAFASSMANIRSVAEELVRMIEIEPDTIELMVKENPTADKCVLRKVEMIGRSKWHERLLWLPSTQASLIGSLPHQTQEKILDDGASIRIIERRGEKLAVVPRRVSEMSGRQLSVAIDPFKGIIREPAEQRALFLKREKETPEAFIPKRWEVKDGKLIVRSAGTVLSISELQAALDEALKQATASLGDAMKRAQVVK